MNITAQALVFAVASVAVAAAVGTSIADSTAQTEQQHIVKLERVVITGKRMEAPTEVAVLPRVVITGKRAVESSDVHMASVEVSKI